MRKNDRIWAQRSEAVVIIAAMNTQETVGAVSLAAALFNSSAGKIQQDVDKHRASMVALLKETRAREDALLAEHAAAEKAATGTDTAPVVTDKQKSGK